MARHDGKPFEKLAYKLYSAFTANDPNTQVEHDVQLPGPDGSRQIDVLIRTRVVAHDLLTVVECRDHKSVINVTAVDGFHSKMLDVNASKGIFVARKGYSKTARQKAHRLNIDLMLAADGAEALQALAKRVPVVIQEYTVSVQTEVTIETRGGNATLLLDKFQDELMHFGGENAIQVFHRNILEGCIPLPDDGTASWEYRPGTHVAIGSVSGADVRLAGAQYKYALAQMSYYVGNLDQFESAAAIVDVLGTPTMGLIDSNDLYGSYSTFPKFDALEKLPVTEWQKLRLPLPKVRDVRPTTIVFRDWSDHN